MVTIQNFQVIGIPLTLRGGLWLKLSFWHYHDHDFKSYSISADLSNTVFQMSDLLQKKYKGSRYNFLIWLN